VGGRLAVAGGEAARASRGKDSAERQLRAFQPEMEHAEKAQARRRTGPCRESASALAAARLSPATSRSRLERSTAHDPLFSMTPLHDPLFSMSGRRRWCGMQVRERGGAGGGGLPTRSTSSAEARLPGIAASEKKSAVPRGEA